MHHEEGSTMNDSPAHQSESKARVALCLAAITMVGIDGEFRNEELDKLRTFIANDEHAFTDAIEIYNWRPLDQCIDLVDKELNQAQKKVVIKILYEYAHVDNEFDPSEKALLKRYGDKFGFSEQLREDICAEPKTDADMELFNA